MTENKKPFIQILNIKIDFNPNWHGDPSKIEVLWRMGNPNGEKKYTVYSQATIAKNIIDAIELYMIKNTHLWSASAEV
jgi:hypothetical protein